MTSSEIVIPKKRTSEIVTVSFSFCLFSLLIRWKPTLGGFDMLLFYFCKCFHIGNYAFIYTSKHLKFSSYLYKHKSLCSFLLLVGLEKPEQHKLHLLDWCHDEQATEKQKTFEISSWGISDKSIVCLGNLRSLIFCNKIFHFRVFWWDRKSVV